MRPENETAFEIFKKGLITFIVRRIMEWGGGAVFAYGLFKDESDLTIVIGALVVSASGFIWSAISKKKDLATPTEESRVN